MLRYKNLLIAAGFFFACGIQPASADVFGIVLGDGFSKDNPTDPPNDISSSFGASLAGSQITFDTDSGILKAVVTNSGAGIVTGFGFSLSTAFDGLSADFEFTTDPNCPGCDFEDQSPLSSDGGNGVAGSFDTNGTFDAGGVRTKQGGVSNGIEVGETGTFTWDFDETQAEFSAITGFFGDGGLTSVVSLIEVPSTGHLTTDGSNKTAFWVAHIQDLGSNGNDSDRIGGSSDDTVEIPRVPEPSAFALFGIGVAGLVCLRRRRKAAWPKYNEQCRKYG